jgi:hypothetical protein
MNKLIFRALALILFFTACKRNEKAISDSGMEYKIVHGSGKYKNIQHGDFVKINFIYKLKSNDSVLNSSYDSVPIYFKVDTANLGKYTFTEIILNCRMGDKIDFSLSIDTLVKMGELKYNNVFKSNDIILGNVEITNIFNDNELVDADYNKELIKLEYRKGRNKPEVDKKSQDCAGFGNKSCIDKVRENFNNTGKSILEEQYLGNGQFGISFLDPSRGQTYNAKVSTDCNCKILNVNISIMR